MTAVAASRYALAQGLGLLDERVRAALVRLAGPLADTFGVCANEFANDDGRVVAFQHGCGAHSEAQLRKKQLPPPLPDPVFDTLTEDDFDSF